MISKKLPKKHLSKIKTINDATDQKIRGISQGKNLPYLLAMHEYFENKLERWL